MDMRRVARTALAVPLLIGGGMLALTVGTATVFAASSATPQTSSKKPGTFAYTWVLPPVSARPTPCSTKVTGAKTAARTS